MDEAARALVDAALSRLREAIGPAWSEPPRIEVEFKSKLRGGSLAYQWQLRLFGEAVEVTIDSSYGTARPVIRSRRRS